jgi:MFS family permease
MFELLLRRPSFRALWAAGSISLIGDWLGFVAISRLALDQNGGPITLALVFAAHILPHTWAMPITGVIADRVDRRQLLVIVPILQAILTVAMAMVASRGALVPLQALVIVRATFAACMPPAEAAALRHTVEPSDLVRANALLSSTWSVAYVAGMALGGAIAVLGPTMALLLDATSFAVAALLATSLPPMPAPSDGRAKDVRAFVLTVPRDLKNAFEHARLRPTLFRAMLGKAPVALGGGAGWILLNLVADQSKPLGTAAISLGILQAVRGAGTGIGPVCVAWFSRGATPSRNIERLAVFISFLSIVFFTWIQSPPVALLAITLLWGIGTGTNWVLSSANLQRLAPDDMIGRLSSLDELCTTACLVLGAILAAWLLEVGLTMPEVAIIGTGLGMVLFVWLDQRQRAASEELTTANASGSAQS